MQIEVRCCSVGGSGEQLCAGAGGAGEASSHEKYPGWTLPGHMPVSLLRQRVGLLPLSIKGVAAGPSSPRAAARGEGGLGMPKPSRCWEPGHEAAPVTGEPHLGCVLGIIIRTVASRYQESWE